MLQRSVARMQMQMQVKVGSLHPYLALVNYPREEKRTSLQHPNAELAPQNLIFQLFKVMIFWS